MNEWRGQYVERHIGDDKMTLTGGCLCGRIRYQTSAEPLWVCHCHCERCRRQTGAPVATYVGFPAGTVTWLDKEPTRYRSSKDVERSFCPVCGSTMGFHRVHETSLCVGSFDTPEALPVAGIWTGHVWFKEHIPWFETVDDWTRYSEFPPHRAEELKALSGQVIKG
jgi:hypothetical protein